MSSDWLNKLEDDPFGKIAEGGTSVEGVEESSDWLNELPEDPFAAKTIPEKVPQRKPIKEIDLENVFKKENAAEQYKVATAKTEDLKKRIAAYPATVKSVYKMADMMMARGRLFDKEMEGTASKEDLKNIKLLGDEIGAIHLEMQDNPYEAKAAAQLMPFLKNAVVKGGKGALVGSMVAGSIVLAGGSILPGPMDELVAMIPAMKAGASVGSMFAVAEDMRKIEGGSAYGSLKEAGVHPDIAKWAGRTYGLASAGIEFGQLKILKGLLPGAKNIAPEILKKAVEKVVNKKVLETSVAKAAGKYVSVVTAEAMVETTQQFAENVIAVAAKEFQDYARETNLAPETATEYWEEFSGGLTDTFAQTFVGMGIIGAPAVGVNVLSDIRGGKADVKRLEDQRLRAIEEMEEADVEADAIEKGEEVVAPREEEKAEPEVVEKPTPEDKVVEQKPREPVEAPVVGKVKPAVKETKKVQKEKDKKVKFKQKDLTQPAIRTADGAVYAGTEFTGTWSISKPNVAVKEGTASYSAAREAARSEGTKLDGHEQGFIVNGEFVSTKTVADKFGIIEKVAKKKAKRIAKQGMAELATVEKQTKLETIRREKLGRLRKPTEQDTTVVKEMQPLMKKAANSFRNESPALASLFNFDELVNVANEGMLNYILKTNPADIDAYVSGKDKAKIKGSGFKAASFSIKNYVKKQLGAKQGKSRRTVAKELEERIFRDTKTFEEDQVSSVAENQEAAVEEAHFEGKEAPRSGKSIKDKFLGKPETKEEGYVKVKRTATKPKKISVKQYLAEKKKAEAASKKIEEKKLKGAKEKFKSHRPTIKTKPKKKLKRAERKEEVELQRALDKAAIPQKETVDEGVEGQSTIVKTLMNEKGETTILGDAAATLIEGYESVKKDIGFIHDWVDVESSWKRMLAPDVGKAFKALFSIQSMEQQKGVDVAKDFMKIVKESHKGYSITRKDLGEITLAAEDPAYLDKLKPIKRARIEPAAKFLAKYFVDSQKELADKGIKVNFTKRMIAELEQKSLEEKDAEKRDKIDEQIKILERIQFVHIPIQMWTMGKTKQLLSAKTTAEFKKKHAELKLTLIKQRRAISLGSLVAKNAIKVEKINPIEIILNYANKKGKDFSIVNVRDAAIKEGLIKYQKTKPKTKAIGTWVRIPKRLAALSIEGKLQGWTYSNVITTIDETIGSVKMQSKFDKTIAITKMAAFYNPFFLPAYDLVQFTMLGPLHVHQIPGVAIKAIKDIYTKSDDYYAALRDGTFSKPFALPFSKWKSTAEKLTIETTAGWYTAQFSGMAAQIFNVKKGAILKPLYELSWTTAWKLDEVIRMMSYNYLTKRGHSSVDAAQTAAKFHGDYAGVPAKTRKDLNRFFFTPTFKIAMGGLWAHMLKNVITTIGGLRKIGTTKMQRRLAYGFMCTAGINMAYHLLMTQILGFEDDQWGRRYVKKVYTAQGPKEIVVTWSHPANIALKYLYRVQEAFKPGVANPLKHLWDSNRWEVHPVYRATISIFTNKRAGGEEIWNENDDAYKKMIKGINYFAESIVGMYSGMKMMTGKHGGTYSTQQARKILTEEWGVAWKYFFQHFAFAYMRDPKDKRSGQKIKAMVRRFNQAVKKSERETKGHDKTWEKNLKKKIRAIEKDRRD